MDLEKNNIKTQISLMGEIINNDDSIFYCVASKAKVVFDLLTTGKHSNDNASVTLTKEDFDEAVKLLRILSNRDKYSELGYSAENAVPDNKVKKKILSMLQAS